MGLIIFLLFFTFNPLFPSLYVAPSSHQSSSCLVRNCNVSPKRGFVKTKLTKNFCCCCLFSFAASQCIQHRLENVILLLLIDCRSHLEKKKIIQGII